MSPKPETLTDARGVEIAPGPYGRVVSLVPSLTESIFGLGAQARLVGRTTYCIEPKGRLTGILACGGTKNPELDTIFSLAPDLVLACVEENKPEHIIELEEGGVPVFAVMPRSLDDVSTLLRQYGVLLDAQIVAGRTMADLTAARLHAGEFRASLARPPRAATLIWKKPWMVAGGGNHIDAVMREVGLVNTMGDREGYYEVELDDLVAKNLDLVLLPDEPFPFTHHASWSMAAGGVVPTRKRALLMDGKLLSWYGTRTARSLRALVKMMSGAVGGLEDT
ncbi:MAG: ABC transporter substrate-binding protein [Candidatus Krumholzibacteria bacterium]|nr:ABC transporter substrate-binding protein [Candidatus Krumholzibacteria bacterium]